MDTAAATARDARVTALIVPITLTAKGDSPPAAAAEESRVRVEVILRKRHGGVKGLYLKN